MIHYETEQVILHAGVGLDFGDWEEDTEPARAATRPTRPNGAGVFLLDGCSTVAELRALAAQGAKTPKGRDAARTLARYEAANAAPAPVVDIPTDGFDFGDWEEDAS